MFRSNLRTDLPPQEFYQNIQNSKMSIARISPFCRLHVSLDKYDPNSSNQVVGENGNWTNSNESFPEDGGAEKHFEFWLWGLVNILNQSRICVEDVTHEKSRISHTKNPNFCTCSEIGDRSPTTAAGWCPSWLWKLLDTIFQTTQISWKLFGNTFYTSNITPLCYSLLNWASTPLIRFLLNFVTKWKILYEIFCVKSQQFIYFKRGHLQITVCVSIYKGGLQKV